MLDPKALVRDVRSIFAALLGVCASVMFAAGAAADEAWSPETFTLDNGMQAVVLPDHRAPVVTHMVWYRVGAADEAPGKSGIAHFFEHLMFKATDERPAGEFSKTVARNGGQDNAFTSQDFTAYFQRVAKDRLPLMMRMEADRMTDLQLTDDEVLPEREVVKEERRQRVGNSPAALLQELAFAALYRDHPYAIPIIGFMEEVEQLTRADALAFYEEWYGPENAILVVAGDITAAELQPLANEIYGAIAPKGDLAARAWPEVTPLPDDVAIEAKDPKVRQPQFARYWLGLEGGHPDAEALTIAIEILGGGRTSRFNRAIVEEQKLAVAAYAFAQTDSIAEGVIGVGATPAGDTPLEQVIAAVEMELNKFIEEGPTEEELTRAKSNVAAAAIYARDSQSSMANWFGALLARGKSVEDVLGWEARIRAVSREDVMRVMEAYFTDTKHVSTRLLPETPE